MMNDEVITIRIHVQYYKLFVSVDIVKNKYCFLVSLQSKRASEETSSVCEEIRSDHYSPAGSMDTKHTSYSQNDPFVRLPDRKEADFPSDPFRLSRN